VVNSSNRKQLLRLAGILAKMTCIFIVCEGLAMARKGLLLLLFLFTLPVYAGFYLGTGAKFSSVKPHHTSFIGGSPQWTLGFDNTFANSFFGALEIYADYPYGTINTFRNIPVTNIRLNSTFGASFLPGWIVDEDVSIFLRLGGVASDFSTYNKSLKGYELGGGMNYCLWDGISLRLEYDFVKYRELNSIVGHPKANEGLIGFIYRFDCVGNQCD
jgi:opacity protein-like surface antigen